MHLRGGERGHRVLRLELRQLARGRGARSWPRRRGAARRRGGSAGGGSAGGSGRSEDAPRRNSWATRHAAACAASRLSSSPSREDREGGSKHVPGVAEWSDRETVKRIIRGQWPPAELIG